MRRIKKLTSEILQTADSDELRYVVQRYAGKNKDFNHYLLLKFLHLIPSDKPVSKYADFLSSYLRNFLDRPDKITPRVSKQLSGSLEELRQQSLDLLSTKNYIEAYGIIINLVLYSSLLIEKSLPHADDHLLVIEGKVNDALSKMLDIKLPRPLMDEIEKDLRSMVTTGSVRTIHPEKNILDTLLNQKETATQRKNIVLEFIQYNDTQPPKAVTTQMAWKAILHQLVKYKYKPLLNNLLKREVLSISTLIDRIKYYSEQGHSPLSETLIEASIQSFNSASKPVFYELKFKGELESNKYPLANKTLISLIQSSYTTVKTIEKSLRQIPEDFKSQFKKYLLEEDYKEIIGSRADKKVNAHILIWLGREKEVLEWVKDQGDIGLLLAFNKPLFLSIPEELNTAYKAYLDEYLGTHIGKRSIEHVSTLLVEIKKSGTRQLAEHLEKYIHEHYGYRKSIVNFEYS
nr:hypothetical protein [Saprospiraceae bacterium]